MMKPVTILSLMCVASFASARSNTKHISVSDTRDFEKRALVYLRPRGSPRGGGEKGFPPNSGSSQAIAASSQPQQERPSSPYGSNPDNPGDAQLGSKRQRSGLPSQQHGIAQPPNAHVREPAPIRQVPAMRPPRPKREDSRGTKGRPGRDSLGTGGYGTIPRILPIAPVYQAPIAAQREEKEGQVSRPPVGTSPKRVSLKSESQQKAGNSESPRR